MADFLLPVTQVKHLFRLATPISHGLRFLVCDSQNQNQQTEMLKEGVNNRNKKMGVCQMGDHLSLITKPLEKLWQVHSLKRDHSLPQLLSWQVSQVARKPTLRLLF